MNKNHDLCSSPEWADYFQSEVLPVITRDLDLGRVMLEVGPGPGAATDWLQDRVERLIAVESDAELAANLIARTSGSNVEIVTGDATAMTFENDEFDSAGCFTMLHHVPTVALQNRLFSEVLRVLRPGCVFVGSDSLPSDALHKFHDGDTYNPLEPGTLLVRLQTVGFERITVIADDIVKFVAFKPGSVDE